MKKTALLLLLGGGAGSAHYSESDNRKAMSADLGTTFYVSLLASMTGNVTYSAKVLTLEKDTVVPAEDPGVHRAGPGGNRNQTRERLFPARDGVIVV